MKYKCESCHDTGWYGDNGPGRKGNRVGDLMKSQINENIRKKISELHRMIHKFIEIDGKTHYQNIEDENSYLESVVECLDINRKDSRASVFTQPCISVENDNIPKKKFRFQEVYCSQCGGTFGPRDSGYSHCEDHRKEHNHRIHSDTTCR